MTNCLGRGKQRISWIEGKLDPDDGRGKTVWDTFTEQGRIFQNQNAYTSCDHMHHYKDDYALMKNLGIKAYRFFLKLGADSAGRHRACQ